MSIGQLDQSMKIATNYLILMCWKNVCWPNGFRPKGIEPKLNYISTTRKPFLLSHCKNCNAFLSSSKNVFPFEKKRRKFLKSLKYFCPNLHRVKTLKVQQKLKNNEK